MQRGFLATVMAAFCCGFLGFAAQAAPLSLTQGIAPDITISVANTSYATAIGGGTFTVSGSTASFDLDGQPDAPVPPGHPDFSGAAITGTGVNKKLALNMTLTNTGGFSTGTFSVTGHIVGLAESVGSILLTGNITAFGFDTPTGPNPNPSLFEMTFHVTGGDLAADFGGTTNGTGGIILDAHSWDAGSLYTGVFTSPFASTSFSGNADIFATPEPSFLGMLVISWATISAGSRRRRLRAS